MDYPQDRAPADPGNTVLVTGHRGVLGRRVAANLAGSLGKGNLLRFDGDISSESDVHKFVDGISALTHVVNCAAVVPVSTVARDPLRAFKVNGFGAGVLAQAVASKFPGAHFLHVSTSHVYKPKPGRIGEDDELSPSSVYGKTKLTGEFLVEEVSNATGLSVGIARVFSMFAPDQESSFLFPGIQERLRRRTAGQALELLGWNNVRDFSSADEIARCLVWLSGNRVDNAVNVGTGKGLTVGQFAERVAGEPLLFGDTDADMAPSEVVADTSRLEALGCTPPVTDFGAHQDVQ